MKVHLSNVNNKKKRDEENKLEIYHINSKLNMFTTSHMPYMYIFHLIAFNDCYVLFTKSRTGGEISVFFVWKQSKSKMKSELEGIEAHFNRMLCLVHSNKELSDFNNILFLQRKTKMDFRHTHKH